MTCSTDYIDIGKYLTIGFLVHSFFSRLQVPNTFLSVPGNNLMSSIQFTVSGTVSEHGAYVDEDNFNIISTHIDKFGAIKTVTIEVNVSNAGVVFLSFQPSKISPNGCDAVWHLSINDEKLSPTNAQTIIAPVCFPTSIHNNNFAHIQFKCETKSSMQDELPFLTFKPCTTIFRIVFIKLSTL